MSTIQLALTFGSLLFSVFISAASETSDVDKSANLLQLCPVADKGGADRKMYSFSHAIKHKDSDNFSSGWYDEKPVVDLGDLKAVRTEVVEMLAAPFRGIVFGFTDAGYTKIAKHLEAAEPKELVLILDGQTYSVLEIETLRETVKAKGEFIVFIAEPSSKIGNHLTSLLVEKLNAHLPQPNAQGEQAGAGQPATRPVDKPETSYKPQPEAEGRRP